MVAVAAKGSKGEAPAEPVGANPYGAANEDDSGGAVDTTA